MSTLHSFIPMSLWPAGAFTLERRWQLLPGVRLERIGERTRPEMDTYYRNMPVAIQGGHPFALVVEHQEYLGGLKGRTSRMTELPDWPITRDIAKLFLLSSFLLCPISFRLGGYFSGRLSIKPNGFHPAAYGHHDEEQVHMYRRLGLSQDRPPSSLSPRQITTKMLFLERYFRIDEFRVDRIGAAIAHLWSSLCTPYKEQALLSPSRAQ